MSGVLAGVPAWPLAVALVAVVLGAAVQGTLGIGLGMLAGPLLALADRGFVPGAILVAVLPLTIAMTVRERHGVDPRGVALALLGRLPGVALGAWAVAVATDRVLAVLVGGTVLVAVGLSLTRIRVRTTSTALVAAGLTSGFMGTTSGVGGPPMAMAYQHADPATMRATVSAYFTVGALMSIGGLVLTGGIGTRQVHLGVLMLPAVALGYAVSRTVARRVPPARIRPAVLVLCSLAALALLAEEFL